MSEAMFGGDLGEAATRLVEALSSSGITLACAESCTGGLAAAAICSVPGASDVLWGGFVAYSNDCKARILGVSLGTLEGHGAVSREAVREMAMGALSASGADLAFAVTGVAGPGGGSADKPVGTVWIAWRSADGVGSELLCAFPGDREAVRRAAAIRAIDGARELAAGVAARGGGEPAPLADIDNSGGSVYSA